MQCGYNKQFKVVQYTAAATPCEINEGAHPRPKQYAKDYSYYALMATKSMSNNFQNWNMQTPSHGKNYCTANHMKYDHNKQFKYYNIQLLPHLVK